VALIRGVYIDTQAYAGRATIHFSQAKHYYTVSIPSLKREKVYQPGVTSIIKIKDKSGPLCWWTAEQCEAYARQRIAELQENVAINGGAPLTNVSLDFVYETLAQMRYHYRNVAKNASDIGKLVHEYLYSQLMCVAFGGQEPLRPRATEDFSEEMCDQANNAIDAGLEFFATHDMKPITLEQPVWSPTYGYVGTDDFIGMVDGELCTCDYKTSKSLYPEVWLQTAAYQHAYQEEYPRADIRARWGINVGKDGTLYAERRGPELFEADFKAFLGLLEIWRWDRIYGNDPKGATEVIGPLPEVGWLEELEAA
jgi:hypothetical protein